MAQKKPLGAYINVVRDGRKERAPNAETHQMCKFQAGKEFFWEIKSSWGHMGFCSWHEIAGSQIFLEETRLLIMFNPSILGYDEAEEGICSGLAHRNGKARLNQLREVVACCMNVFLCRQSWRLLFGTSDKMSSYGGTIGCPWKLSFKPIDADSFSKLPSVIFWSINSDDFCEGIHGQKNLHPKMPKPCPALNLIAVVKLRWKKNSVEIKRDPIPGNRLRTTFYWKCENVGVLRKRPSSMDFKTKQLGR